MTDMKFYNGQVFEEMYPPEAAEWCNNSGKYYISEIMDDDNKSLNPRKFVIKRVPDPNEQQLKDYFEGSAQTSLNEFAKIKGYDSIESVCSYGSSGVELYANDAKIATKVRDQVWVKTFDIINNWDQYEVNNDYTQVVNLIDTYIRPLLKWE